MATLYISWQSYIVVAVLFCLAIKKINWLGSGKLSSWQVYLGYSLHCIHYNMETRLNNRHILHNILYRQVKIKHLLLEMMIHLLWENYALFESIHHTRLHHIILYISNLIPSEVIAMLILHCTVRSGWTEVPHDIV